MAGKTDARICARLGGDNEFGGGRRALGSSHPAAVESNEIRSGAGFRDSCNRPYRCLWLSVVSRLGDNLHSLPDLNLSPDRACWRGFFLDEKEDSADQTVHRNDEE